MLLCVEDREKQSKDSAVVLQLTKTKMLHDYNVAAGRYGGANRFCSVILRHLQRRQIEDRVPAQLPATDLDLPQWKEIVKYYSNMFQISEFCSLSKLHGLQKFVKD